MCRIMYQARDISATVGCLGLITSSIISKKVGMRVVVMVVMVVVMVFFVVMMVLVFMLALVVVVMVVVVVVMVMVVVMVVLRVVQAAEGIGALVLDIKWGSGCYQATLGEAEAIAEALLQVPRRGTVVVAKKNCLMGV